VLRLVCLIDVPASALSYQHLGFNLGVQWSCGTLQVLAFVAVKHGLVTFS
jgi:hypothetical protein